MSKGKYSPAPGKTGRGFDAYCYNADKQIPPECGPDEEYDTRTHFTNYDEDGFDYYGYSAFDSDGNYVGIGDYGIDRWGYSENDYLMMSNDEYDDICMYGG